MKVSVLVPRRSEEWRDRLWHYVEGVFLAMDLEWQLVVELDDGTGPFNRSALINRAAARAEDWEVAVILDADSIPDRDQLVDGVEAAALSGQLVLPHSEFHSIDKASTRRILAGEIAPAQGATRWVLNDSKSSCLCVGRDLWDDVGGFDENFLGWGFEDAAFYAACQAIGGLDRIPGPVYHLWHPRSSEKDPHSRQYQANRARADLYKERRCDAGAMRALLADFRDDEAFEAFATGRDHP